MLTTQAAGIHVVATWLLIDPSTNAAHGKPAIIIIPNAMRRVFWLLLLFSISSAAAEHTVVLGKWRLEKIISESGETRELRVRRLLVDGRTREYTAGSAHDVTDRIFVVQRVSRINDALPKDSGGPQWVWRPDAWISVDRMTGRVTQLSLPGFDLETSQLSWYRDYAAYCGLSEEGKQVLVVAQLGKRKPLLKKDFAGPGCVEPKWDRGPIRVTFVVGGEKTVFTLGPHSRDLQLEADEEKDQ